jgi:methylglyoxal synthase
MEKIKNIALVAHDNRKRDLIEWFEYNYRSLIKHKLICTGTTGKMIEESLKLKLADEPVHYYIKKLKSGPLGGDQQLGAMITEGQIDLVIFLWDPMQPHPHDVDVKALLRIAVLYNVPIACNRATADFIMSSPLMNERYSPELKNFESYIRRDIDLEKTI